MIKNCDALWTEEQETEVISILQGDSNAESLLMPVSFIIIGLTFRLNVCLTNVARKKIMATKVNVFSIIKNLYTACGYKRKMKIFIKISEHYVNNSNQIFYKSM